MHAQNDQQTPYTLPYLVSYVGMVAHLSTLGITPLRARPVGDKVVWEYARTRETGRAMHTFRKALSEAFDTVAQIEDARAAEVR